MNVDDMDNYELKLRLHACMFIKAKVSNMLIINQVENFQQNLLYGRPTTTLVGIN